MKYTNPMFDKLELFCYRHVGTLKEFRKAKNKQIPVIPKLHKNEVEGEFIEYEDGTRVYREYPKNNYHCPVCDNIVGDKIIIKYKDFEHKHIQNKKKYCDKCGQAILW